VYFAGGALVWFAMLGSGVHATLAGILVAKTVPARASRSPQNFVRRSRQLINEFESIEQQEDKASSALAEPLKHDVVEQLQDAAAQSTTPLQLWENSLNHPVALFVLPLFAMANASIELNIAALPHLFSQPMALGIISGLAVGKLLGITLPTFAVLALGYGRLPEGMRRVHLPGLALLGGIGFTLPIFIAGLSFAGHPEQLLVAKTGILTASVLAGLAGYLWLKFAVPAQAAVQAGNVGLD
jgi:NhaA family Na+:H+ antiporter